MPSASSKSKPKPSEVASEAKRYYIPTIREKYASTWSTCSYIYHQPLLQINFPERPLDLSPPHFCKHPPLPNAAAVSLLTLPRCFKRRPGQHRHGLGRSDRVCHSIHLRGE